MYLGKEEIVRVDRGEIYCWRGEEIDRESCK